jgi:hypothetical protein
MTMRLHSTQDEAVYGMTRGSIRRIVIPGDHPELGWSLDRKKRYLQQGPRPRTFDGERTLDFVLDNGTLDQSNKCDLRFLLMTLLRKDKVL